jgi:ribokinase
MRDIVVVGSLNVDVSVAAEGLPAPGQTVRASGLEIGPGGKGLNQAVAAARLGGRVHMVGAVGDDRFAEIPLAALEAAGVDTTYVVRGKNTQQHTGTALIVVDRESGENAIAVAGGANAALTPELIRQALGAFRASSVLLVQLEVPLQTVEAALELAREQRMITVLDPAPATALPETLLRKVDIMTPNETEAELLTGTAVHDLESAAVAGSRLRELTQGDVIVTLGEAGCVWVWPTGFEHIPAPEVQPVDSTGAGDAFNGGLALALARGDSIARALRQAVRSGAAATLTRGAAEAMPRPDDLARLPGG